MRRAIGPAACLFAVLLSVSALSFTAGRCEAQDPTAADRDAAATAYDRGTSAYLSHEYPRAAQWFETAYRLAPNPQALLGAIRAHERAGDLMRAATLALRAAPFHPDDPALARQAATTLEQATPIYLRIDVSCSSSCTVELDGTVQSHTSFFVTPDAEHRVIATFETGPAETTVSGPAGESRAVSLEAPVGPVIATVGEGGEGGSEDPTDTTPVAGSGGGLSPAFLVTGAILTAAAGGVLIWSGIDALDGVPAYEADPTPERLADGQMRELRTNVMIGVTAGLAVTTLVFALVTDWDGDPVTTSDPEDGASAEEPSPEATSVSIAPMFDDRGVADGVVGGIVTVGGRF